VAAIIREKLAVSKQTSQKFDVEIFNHRNLNELEVMNGVRFRPPSALKLFRT